jgi:hypothetical protein
MIEGLPGGFPAQGSQHSNLVDGPGGQLWQHVIEVITQINLKALAGLRRGQEEARSQGGPDAEPAARFESRRIRLS